MTPSKHPSVVLDLQIATSEIELPSKAELLAWLKAIFSKSTEPTELTIRVVSSDESQRLNHTYRSKDKPTNVLSFPSDLPDHIDEPYIGDLVICAEVVKAEALEQNKRLKDHWSHMVIHGTLHLLGYDHIDDAEAEEMEALEIEILSGLGIANPYEG